MEYETLKGVWEGQFYQLRDTARITLGIEPIHKAKFQDWCITPAGKKAMGLLCGPNGELIRKGGKAAIESGKYQELCEDFYLLCYHNMVTEHRFCLFANADSAEGQFWRKWMEQRQKLVLPDAPREDLRLLFTDMLAVFPNLPKYLIP